jgi:hypothetical protein
MKTFTLEYPVTAPDGDEIKELKLRRLKGKEMKGVDLSPADGKIGGVLKFVAAMNDLPSSVMDELDGADVLELIGEASPFLARGTGATPSS